MSHLVYFLQLKACRAFAAGKCGALEHCRGGRVSVRRRCQQQAQLIQLMLLQKRPVDRSAAAYQHGADAEVCIQLFLEQPAVQCLSAASEIGDASLTKIFPINIRSIFQQHLDDMCFGTARSDEGRGRPADLAFGIY